MVIVFEFISAILQIIAFTFIPFIFFLFRKDKSITFFQYIGIVKPTKKSILYAVLGSLLFVIAGISLVLFDESVKQAVLNPPSVTGKLRAMGFGLVTIVTLLITAWLKTSLSEEIFFRGFIAKRLINGLGFQAGNLLQSAIFGIVHVLIFWSIIKGAVIPLIGIFLFSSLAGWIIGLIKEKYANGSIIPGWIAHGLGNTVSYFVLAFLI
ncbi:MAG: CPBP family intramembrane metalloprotease [Ignavibacteriae bacterium]|nr:MAG: CPBP family intramembrane metalloprotease [Ignavibacteriota bacterium]